VVRPTLFRLGRLQNDAYSIRHSSRKSVLLAFSAA